MNMGKFPGKPSKIVNKKRVKASKCSQFQENDSVKAAENIYFGLAVFNEAFGSEQVTEFHGFSAQEARAAVVYAKKQQREVISEYEANGLHTSLKEHFEQELSRATFNVACSSQQEVIESGTHVQHCFDGGGKLNSNRDRTLPKKLTSRSPPVTPSHLKNKAAKKLLQRAKKASNYGSVASVDNSQQEKGSGAIRKFVLPSRSIHSSRVIKPNKRFIEAEEVLSDVSVSRCPSVIQLKKPRLILNPLKNPLELPESNRDVSVTNEDVLEQVKKDGVNCEKPEPLFSYNSSDGSNRSFSLHNSSHENSLIVEGKRRWKPSYKVQLKLRELNVFGAGTNRFPSKRADASSSDSTRSIHSVSDKESHSVSTDSSECGRLLAPTNSEVKSESSSYWTGSKLTSGRVILRKARLKLNTQSSPGVDGPFSVNLNSGNPSLPGTVVCGVCGAVRFYRFVKQARKFGIFSCESCRKFVSKMMKRQGSSKGGKLPVLECHKGQGTCSVPPIVRSQQWKPGRGTQFRCSYKARCPACWLKMCLRSFNMPDALRESMALMLPPEMRKDLDKLPRNKLCINFESTSSFMRSKPVEMEKLAHVSLMNASGSRPSLYTTKTEGKGIGTNIFDFSGRVEQKPTVISLKEQSKQDKQRDLERGRPDKRQKEKHRHTNRILKKATKKLMKSKDNAKSSIERLRKKKNSGIKVRKKDGQKGDSSFPGSDVTRRQRLDLKGPRVKHVCRSASIVLGQPQATFPLDKRVEKIQVKPIQEVTKVPPKGSCCLDCTVSGSSAVKIHDTDKNFQDHSVGDASRPTKMVSASVDVDSADNGDVGRPLSSAETTASSQDGEPSVSSTYRRSSKPSMQPSTTVPPQPPSVSTLPVPPMARTLPVLGKRAVPEPQDLVSIDFWESYDPEEVCNTGFGLIGSEPFHVRAMCFLCGSAGREKLIHCASCCEPYHRFCLEDGLRDTSFLADSNHGNSEEWRYNWVCQRCTVCHSCGRGLGQQLSCQRCHRTYHTECLGADRLSGRLHSPDRPWVCSSCLRCKSCGSADVTVFVGNLPHCKACFKLRQKGNYCPLCQRCYEDDDYDTKMMECGQCKCWVHAKCEGLSDEKYQVLSYLPESVEFICRMCCAIPPAPWWLAVEEELKAGYLGVLKSLSKNRKACAMLKWSPKKQCLCRPALVAKKLDFQEISDKETETDDQSDSVREDTRIAVISNKDGFLSSQQEIGSSCVTIHTSETEPCEMERNPHDAEQNHTLLKSALQPRLPITDSLIATSVLETERKLIVGSLPDSSSSKHASSNPTLMKSSAEKSLSANITVTNNLRHLREKYNIRECSVRIENCVSKASSKLPLTVKIEDNDTGFSPDSTFSECSSKSPAKVQVVSMATPASDSGIGSTDDELKPNYIEEEQEYTKDEGSEAAQFSPSLRSSQLLHLAFRNSSSVDVEKCSEMNCDMSENVTSESTKECYCLDQHTLTKPSPTLLSIKKKVNANEYSSLLQFHQEMEQLIASAQCPDLLETYHHTLKEIFPWFDPKYARVSINWKEGRPCHEETSCIPASSEQDCSFSQDQITEQINLRGNTGETEGSVYMTPKFMEGKSDEYYYSGFSVQDLRTCTLCKGVGDGLPVEEGRLLYCGQNEWVHANCALWSAEVFEEIDGSLQNVHSAVSRGRMIRCRACGKKGASVGCCARNCAETFHFPCARQIGCAFMDDKTVFCATHLTEAAGKSLHLDVEFDIRRPVYVELDRKKKKYAEPCQVKFMIGSLLIENLGEFVPASDHSDIIVPADFQCTRLYWSSVEPWRIVRYYVRTTVQVAEPQLVVDLGKNLTVDHTQEQKLVKQKLEEVSRWHQQLISCQNGAETKIPDSLENLKTKIYPFPVETHAVTQGLNNETQNSTDEKVARQVMDQLLDAVCSKDVDDSCLSDPQNTADLLPPELEDEIFEDLPHDLLDGISMQDIFPKLMSCEDLTSVDVKSDMCFGSEVHKEGKEELNEDGILETEVEQVSSYEQVVKSRKDEQPISELGTHADLWFHQCSDSKEQVQEIVEDLFQNVYAKGSVQMHSPRELKRSKSEVIPQPVSKKIGSSGRSHQRSCSLTWSCKLDGTLTSSTKRRKGTKTVSRSGGEGASSLVMVVDSERAHMLQELRLPDGVLVALARSGTSGMAPSVADSMRELKYRLEEDAASSEIARRRSTHQKEEGKENKCLLWHGRSQPRILQLDGAIDSGSSSSSGSEGGSPTRHVDDDLNPFPLTAACKNLHNALAGKTACDEEPVKCDRCHRTYRTRSSFERHLPTCSSDFILSTSESDSENTRSSEEEGSKRQKFPTVNHQNATSPALELENDPEKQGEGITENVKSKSECITVSSLSSHSPSSQSHPKTSQTSYRLHAVNGRPRGRQSSRTYSHRSVQKENPTAVMNMHPHLQQSQHSVPCQTHPSQQPAAPTVIMQQVPSPNMVPAFVEAFQQQTGQSLQYIATIDAHNNGYSKTPYLTAAPNSLVPGTFQLQASPESYVGLQNGGISVLPSVQLAPPQPAVIGTLIHQTPPATIQCVAAEQVVLGSTPAIEMYTDPAGGMYLTSQPMYYGLETIVSNTVMSSSQFVSAAMPGMMAASSSFSATTTQVFQASKLVEPIVDVPSSFVIMSPHTTQLPSDSGLGRPDVLACATSQLPMNVPSPAAPQPSPHVISQTQAPPVHNVPWSYPEYRSPQSYMPPSRDFQHCPPHAPQNARANTSNISQNVSCTLSMPPAAPPPTPPAKLPPPAPIPPPPLPCVPSQSQPLAQHKTNEFIQIQVPVSINANSAVHDHTSDSAAKLLKTTNHVEVPIRTINRVFPLKVNASLGGTQPVPKTNETGTDEGINNRTIHGTDGRVTIIPIPQNKTGNNNGNKQPNSLKLVFQKQAQDGYYKISNQNHQAKLVDTPKTVTASNQPVSVRAVKIKPRMVTVTEKQKEGQRPSTPVKQTDIGINTKNGTTNTSHFQNGKMPPFQEKNLLGSNASPTITYEVHSQDGFTCTSSSITEVWQKVFEAVQKARELHKMPRLPQNPFSATSAGLQMLGFRHNALRYLVEQLPGVGRCIKYKPRYHKLHPPGPEEDVDALPRENPSGCARSEPFKMRSPYDMFSWLASRHRQPPKFMLSADNESTISNRRATSSNLPMAMRFRHLKETSKEAVGVYRSNIHGRGLFCLRDIEAGEMVIEYAGEVIRSMLTDKREKYYETKDIGCYMFRIDDQLVVDATMRGNAARFINHSCEPNCYSRVVDILGKKHILIFALRRIPQGEELTYDYKFPFEDVKIPCTCGSRKCRKYLN